jgi:ribose transport system substrate-binding protein
MKKLHGTRRLVIGAFAALATVLLAAAAGAQTSATGTTHATAKSADSCPAYDASVLKPRPIPADLNPKAIVPPISSLPSTSADLGTKQKLKPTYWTSLSITPAQQKAICAKHLTGVYMDWAGVPFNQAIRWGITDVFKALGIKLLRITNWNLNGSAFPANLAAVLPLHPNIIMTGGPVSPAQFGAIMQPAANQGAAITTWALGAQTWDTGAGQPLKAVIGYDFYHLGTELADAIHQQYPNGVNFGYIHWVNDANAILNREQGMLDELKKYPNIHIITNGTPSPKNPQSGFTDPNGSEAFTVAFLKAHPEVQLLFAPWEDNAAIGESAAIKAAGMDGKVHIATMDLSTNGASQLVHHGAISIDMGEDMYDGGRSMAMSAALSELGAKFYPYVVVPTWPSTGANVEDSWNFMHGPDMPCGSSCKK